MVRDYRGCCFQNSLAILRALFVAPEYFTAHSFSTHGDKSFKMIFCEKLLFQIWDGNKSEMMDWRERKSVCWIDPNNQTLLANNLLAASQRYNQSISKDFPTFLGLFLQTIATATPSSKISTRPSHLNVNQFISMQLVIYWRHSMIKIVILAQGYVIEQSTRINKIETWLCLTSK